MKKIPAYCEFCRTSSLDDKNLIHFYWDVDKETNKKSLHKRSSNFCNYYDVCLCNKCFQEIEDI